MQNFIRKIKGFSGKLGFFDNIARKTKNLTLLSGLLVRRVGLEPTTPALKGRYSTTELSTLVRFKKMAPRPGLEPGTL